MLRHPGRPHPPRPVPARRRPASYPTAYEHWIELDDGRSVFLRPVLPSDAPELSEAIRNADAETLRLRFLGGPPPLTPATLDRLTRIDYRRHFALVARDENDIGVAIGRYVSEGDGKSAEVAVAVDPPWRRVGLATAVVKSLALRAMECGIEIFTASFVAENRPVAELAHEGHARVVVSQGAARMRAQLSAVEADEAAPFG